MANGIVYWGDYNGYEHASNATTGKEIWSAYLGSFYAGSSLAPTYCTPDQMGVTASATVGQVNGTTLLFVPGGGPLSGTSGPLYFFALNPATGAIVWQSQIGSSPADTLWSAPALYNGSIYEGIAGQGSCPNFTRGRLVRLNAATGAVQNTFYSVASGCDGGDIWGSPAIDESAGMVYVTTGSFGDNCAGSEPYAQALVELRASDLSYVSSWQLTPSPIPDSDFGSTPTLFSGGGNALVGVVNKDGVFYTFNRSNLAAGPVWTYTLANPGSSAPEVGDGSVSPAAYDGTNLYIAGGTSPNSTCRGTLQAVNPGTGAAVWVDCLPGFVLPAVTAAPGIVAVGANSQLTIARASDGTILWTWNDPRGTPFWAAPTIANGTLFAANTGWAEPGDSVGPGRLYAFNVATGPTPTPTNTTFGCPAGWSCTDIGSPTVAGSDAQSNGIWTVTGGGGDIWSTGDQFHLDYQTLAGNGSVRAQVLSQSVSDPWAKAGVMLRSGTGPGAAFYDAVATPSNGIVVQYRSVQGAVAVQQASLAATMPELPVYLEVTRSGATFSAYTSSSGTTWTLVPGSTVTLSGLTGSLLAGVAVTAHNASGSSTVTFAAVNVLPAGSPTPTIVVTNTVLPSSTNTATPVPTNTSVPTNTPVSGSGCPAAWACTDIGAPTVAGSDAVNGSVWTVVGGGGDIWGTGDQFHFDYQTLAGNGSVSAEVLTQTSTAASSGWAKAGVMLRGNTGPGAAFYDAVVTPLNGISIQYRSPQGAAAVVQASLAATSPELPVYLEVTRNGTTFSASTSSNGTTWTLVPGSTVTLSGLTGTLLAGPAVTGHDLNGSSTVTFTNVGISPSGIATPTATSTPVATGTSAPTSTLTPTPVSTTPAGPSFVQVASAVPQTSVSTATVTYAAAQRAGDTNILAIGWNDITSTITAVHDSAGNTYQVAAPLTRSSGESQAIYYAKNIPATAAHGNTITVTFNQPAVYVDLRALEYSGLSTTAPFDAAASASGTSTKADSGAAVTHAAPELLVGAGMEVGIYSGAGSGYTTRVITRPDADIEQYV